MSDEITPAIRFDHVKEWPPTRPATRRAQPDGFYLVTKTRPGGAAGDTIQTWHKVTGLGTATRLDCGDPLPGGWPAEARGEGPACPKCFPEATP